MGDKCATEDAGSCAGVVRLAASVDLSMNNSNLVVPAAGATPEEIDASPIADAVRTALVAALAGVEANSIQVTSIITTTARRRLGTAGEAVARPGQSWSARRRLDVDGIAVDYVIVLDIAAAAAVVTASASMAVPDIVIPAEATSDGVAITVASKDIVTEVLKSYAWATTKPACPTACGTVASAPANTVACVENGVTATDDGCLAALG